MTDLLVLGAGPAGLFGALRAARAGRSVTVLERADVVGGLAGSYEVAGVRVDHGSHRLHPSIAPGLESELHDLLGSDLQRRRRNGRIRVGDRWVRFPLVATDMARRLPPRFLMGAGRDVLAAPFRRPRSDTLDEVVRAGLGPTVADAVYRPLAPKLWGMPGTALSGEVARRRIGSNSPFAVARKLAQRPSFLYPRKGFGQISEALADAAVSAGVDVRLSEEVTAVDLADRVSVTVRAGAREYRAGLVWSTLPLPALTDLVSPGPPAAVAEAASRLRHRGMALVHLVLDRRPFTTYDAHYIPTAGLRTSRLSEPTNYRSSRDDPVDRTVLCAEVPADPGDDVWTASDADLGARVVEELARVGLRTPAPEEVVVRRVPRLYPVYRLGYEEPLGVVETWAEADPRLVSFGRQGRFVADNTHHVLAMAEAAADCLTQHGFDHERWQARAADFDDHVVED